MEDKELNLDELIQKELFKNLTEEQKESVRQHYINGAGIQININGNGTVSLNNVNNQAANDEISPDDPDAYPCPKCGTTSYPWFDKCSVKSCRYTIREHWEREQVDLQKEKAAAARTTRTKIGAFLFLAGIGLVFFGTKIPESGTLLPVVGTGIAFALIGVSVLNA